MLSDFKNDIDRRREHFNELVKVTLSEKQALTDQTNNNLQIIGESVKGHNFFQDNDLPGKKCTTTSIKSRNFLYNIAYVGIKWEDFYNKKFIFVYLLVSKKLNPFS